MVWLAICFLIVGWAPPVAAPPQSPDPPAPTSPSPSAAPKLADLSPRCRAVIAKRAKNCYRLPDASICDMNLYYEFMDAAIGSVQYKDKGHYETIPAKYGAPIKVWKVDGKEWTVEPTPAAKAWEITFASPRRSNRSNGDNHLPRARNAPAPLFDKSLSSPGPGLPTALFLDEIKGDPCSKLIGSHYTKIGGSPDGETKTVEVDGVGQEQVVVQVRIPEDLEVNGDWLPGRYLLWPEKKTGASQIYDYVPLEKPVTPQELIDAMHGKGLKLYEWKYRRVKEDYVWDRTEITLELAKKKP